MSCVANAGQRHVGLAIVGVLTGVLAMSTAGCHSSNAAPAATAPPRGAIVVVIDTLRADHLGSYGYARATSPQIDALAADGTRFASAITTAPWTLPALGSLWTSTYPSVHGALRRSNEQLWIRDRANFHPYSVLDGSRVTLAEVLQANGFATAAFIDGCYSSSLFGMGQGFDTVVEDEVDGIRLNVEALLRWIDTTPGRFFVYLHTLEVHSPYTPPGDPPAIRGRSDEAAQRVRQVFEEERRRYATIDFDPDYRGPVNGSLDSLEYARPHFGAVAADTRRSLEHLIALYDRGIAYDDFWIGQLISGLKARGLYDQTAIVVTADHGEEFLEHGNLEHGKTLYDEVLHIPLIMRVPGARRGAVVPDQVGIIDVMPTLLDLLQVGHALTLQGISLAPAFSGGPVPSRRMLFAEGDIAGELSAFRTSQLKYIQGRAGERRQAYDLERDPHETENLCAADASHCGDFASVLDEWESDTRAIAAQRYPAQPPTAVISEDTRERLRALGYER